MAYKNHIKVNGIYKEITKAWKKINGIWTEGKVYLKKDGSYFFLSRGFIIERKVSTGNFELFKVVDNLTSEFKDYDITEGVTYTYRIKTFDGATYSNFSNEVQITATGIVVVGLELHVNVTGTYKKADSLHVNVAGTWKQADSVHVNVAGTWKQI